MIAKKGFLFVIILTTVLLADSNAIVTPYGNIEFDSQPSEDEISGVFNVTQGTPVTIAFRSVARDGFSQLEIANTTAENRVVLSYIFNSTSPIGYIQIGDAIFVENIITKEYFYLQETVIPTELDTLRDEQEFLLQQQQQQQQLLYINKINKAQVLRDLFMKYNTNTIELLSRALGETLDKVLRNSFSVMSIHFAAYALTPIIMKRGQNESRGECPNEESKDCVKKPIGVECLGLCGRGTTCWEYVCDDCCFHEGCYQHDLCCGKYGYFSWQCLDVWNFSCESYNCD